MELLDRVRASLAADAPTETLQALLLETGAEKCWRRNRIIHLLSHYVLLSSPLPMSHSTTHRFKAGFSHADFSGFPLVIGDKTKIVTATNLTDADVPLLKQYGGGHLIEELPKPQDEQAEDLHKLLKPDLQARYREATGEEADSKLTKEELITAIEAKK